MVVVRGGHYGRFHLGVDAEAGDQQFVHRLLSVDAGLRKGAEHLPLFRVGHHVGKLEHLAAVVADIYFVLGYISVETGRVQAAVREFLDEWKALDTFEYPG